MAGRANWVVLAATAINARLAADLATEYLATEIVERAAREIAAYDGDFVGRGGRSAIVAATRDEVLTASDVRSLDTDLGSKLMPATVRDYLMSTMAFTNLVDRVYAREFRIRAKKEV